MSHFAGVQTFLRTHCEQCKIIGNVASHVIRGFMLTGVGEVGKCFPYSHYNNKCKRCMMNDDGAIECTESVAGYTNDYNADAGTV